MRGERLLEILLLLQSRGAMTAERLAGEVGVSVRTIYSDIDALSAAGIPVYGEAGPSGGYRLLNGYRAVPTDLTSGEIAALGLLAVPDGERVRSRIILYRAADSVRATRRSSLSASSGTRGSGISSTGGGRSHRGP